MKYDVIGDIHGCYDEMIALIEKLGYSLTSGVPVHPENRTLVFLGDLTDRGPKSLEVVEFVGRAVEDGAVRYVPGNHCNKLYRFFKGNPVKSAKTGWKRRRPNTETFRNKNRRISETFSCAFTKRLRFTRSCITANLSLHMPASKRKTSAKSLSEK